MLGVFIFFQNWGLEILEIALGDFIAKQVAVGGGAYILNCDCGFFVNLGSSDILNSTIRSESQHEYRNCNCVIVVKSPT